MLHQEHFRKRALPNQYLQFKLTQLHVSTSRKDNLAINIGISLFLIHLKLLRIRVRLVLIQKLPHLLVLPGNDLRADAARLHLIRLENGLHLVELHAECLFALLVHVLGVHWVLVVDVLVGEALLLAWHWEPFPVVVHSFCRVLALFDVVFRLLEDWQVELDQFPIAVFDSIERLKHVVIVVK